MPEFNEAAFQEWYKNWAKIAGINPNPDDPKHLYNYRGAYEAGLEPTWQPEHRQYRWPDRFKAGGYEQKYPYEEDF